MPRSSSSFAAGSIAGMSLLEPMTMPTRGASTSMPSNSASTAVSVWRSCAGLLAHAPAACSAMSRAQLAPVELDHVGGSIRGVPGGTASAPERGDVEDAAAGGHDRRRRPRRCPRAITSTSGGHAVEAADDVAATRRTPGSRAEASTTVTAARSSHSSSTPAEAARARRAQQQVEQVRAQAREHDLRLGVAEADVELEHARPVAVSIRPA